MQRTPLDIFTLFVSSPGDLLFFLLVIALCLGAMFLAFGNRSRFPYEHSTRRYIFATSSQVLIWLVMLGAAALSFYADLEPAQFMPPLERLAFAISLMILAWALLSADFIQWQNRSNVLLFGGSFSALLLYINSTRDWLGGYASGAAFNASGYALLWSLATAAFAAAAVMLLLLNFRHIVDAPLKAVYFAVFFAGNGWDALQLLEGGLAGNYLGGARLAYLLSLSLLPVILYRLSIALLENSLVEVVLSASQQMPGEDEALAMPAAGSQPPAAAAPSGQTSAYLLAAASAMLQREGEASREDHIVSAVSAALDSELCLLLALPDGASARIRAGIEQGAERSLAGKTLELQQQPTLLAALRQGEAVTLSPETHSEQLNDFCQQLALSPPGGLYAQPLALENELLGFLLLSIPRQQRQLPATALEQLQELAILAANILAWQRADSQALELAQAAAFDFGAPDAIQVVEPPSIVGSRQELLASLERMQERSASMQERIRNLRQQVRGQQRALLASLAESENDPSAAAELASAMSQLARIRMSCELSAQNLLEAETVARILAADSAGSLAEILRKSLQGELNLQLTSRDRLRRELTSITAAGAQGSDSISELLSMLQNEAAQLKQERQQLEQRREAAEAKLQSQGMTGAFSHSARVLMELVAERSSASNQLEALKRKQQLLLHEREQLREASLGEDADLLAQLKRLSAEHEELLDGREDMRREAVTLAEQARIADADNKELRDRSDELQAALNTAISEKAEDRQRYRELEEERNNLLRVRDELTALISELVANESANADASQEAHLSELQATIQRLTEQREQLALELSDVRSESAGSYQQEAGLSAMPGKLAPELAPPKADAVGLTPVIDAVVSDMAQEFADKGLLIELSLEEGLPPLPAAETGLKQILIQLLRNAVAVSPAGSSILLGVRSRALRLRSQEEAVAAVEVRVQDSGGGILPADLERVFSQTDRSSVQALSGLSDAGVGLTVARAVARRLHGDLWVTSEAGAGATFHLALPISLPHSTEA